MEHLALIEPKRRLRFPLTASTWTRLLAAGLILFLATPGIGQDDDPDEEEGTPYFSLSANRTYGSNQGPTEIQVSAVDVDTLEFRVYRINDAVKFFEQLEDPRRFGESTRPPAKPRTLLEEIRSWKRTLRANIRRTLRAQFTESPREKIEERVPTVLTSSSEPRPTTREVRYAEAPILNSQQLVLTFQQPVSTQNRWSTQPVDVGVRDKGVYLVEAAHKDLRAYTILMISDIVMTTKTGRGKIMNFVANRTTGEPIEGADIYLLRPGSSRINAKTNFEGIAELPIGDEAPMDVRMVAKLGSDVGANILESYNFASNEDRWMGYIYTDRPIYRPGHTVQFKGIFRARTPDGYVVPQSREVQIQIEGPSGNASYQKVLHLNANGTVRDSLVLPADAPLGYYSIEAHAGDNYMNGSFEVEEYRKPEYEVRVLPQQSRVLQGETATAVIDARYYFGEPVNNAQVKYSVYRSNYYFPIWYDPEDEENGFEDNYAYGGEEIDQGEGTLNADGKLTIQVPTLLNDQHQDLRYRVEARVTDAARREISGSGSFIASFGSFIVHAEPEKWVYRPGQRAAIQLEARNYDNQPIATPVQVELIRWDYRNRDDQAVVARTNGTIGADGKGRVELGIAQAGGSYRVRVSARTPEGRTVEDYAYIWIDGEISNLFGDDNQEVQIVADQKTYKAGDTAHMLIASGQTNQPVLVTVEGRDLKLQKVLASADSMVSFDVPITERDEPGLYVTAQFVRDGIMHRSSKYVRVPPVEHQLNIAITADKPVYHPGDTAVYSLVATDAAGNPVPRAELSLGVVDEAIYAIRPDQMQDPLKFFFGREYNSVSTEDSLSYYFSGEAGKRRMQLAQLRGTTKLAQLKPEPLVQPKIRKAFPDTAFWSADIVTDAQGKAIARVELPDSLTTWRATTRGVTADSKLGQATDKHIARKDLILRFSTPRFFTRGDEMVISAIVHNYLETAKNAEVSLEMTGLEVIAGSKKTVQIPPRGEARVDWRVRAATVGTAKLLGKALTNEESDALEVEIPINAPGVKLSESKGGSLLSGAATNFDLTFPANVEAGSRRIAIHASPSIAGSLFGALEFLTSFPYGCVEQTMSSFLPNIIVEQTMKDLGSKLNVDQTRIRDGLNAKITDGLERLYNFQHDDGGWGWWESDASHPFMTAYVVAGLRQAQAAGTTVRYDVIERGAQWVEKELQSNNSLNPDLRAYMVFSVAGRGSAYNLVDSMFDDRSDLSPYGLALLGLALEQKSIAIEMLSGKSAEQAGFGNDPRSAQVAQLLEQRAQQNAEEAWFEAKRDEMLDFDVDATPEATAFAVRLLSHQRPQSPLLPKAALWLMNHRNEGFWWSSTKQTALVVYGLTDYVKVSNELDPDLTATVTVNGRPVLSRHFTQSTALGEPDLVLTEKDLAPGANRIEVKTSGRGRLYYSTRAEYHSSEEKLERKGAVALNVLRDYFRLTPTRNGDRIVYDTQPVNGPVQSGDMIAVRLTVTGGEWSYLLIEDPIPAGAEFQARDQDIDFRTKPDWWSYYFTRREMHDDRMAMFIRDFPAGQQQYFYVLKVVNPGTFTVSPARVEPMYQPGVLATTGRLQLQATEANQ